MSLSRRMFLGASAALVTGSAQAARDFPALTSYERETGGRIGVYAENLKTGKKITWRTDERFVIVFRFNSPHTPMPLIAGEGREIPRRLRGPGDERPKRDRDILQMPRYLRKTLSAILVRAP